MTDIEKAALERRIDELCAEVEALKRDEWAAGFNAGCDAVEAAYEDGRPYYEVENAKLRELCKTLHRLADESYVPFEDVNLWMDDFAKATCAMRELGIEVD